MWVRTPGHSSRGLVSISRVEVSPFLSRIENNSFAEVACKRDLRAVEVISAGGDYNSAADLKWLGQDIVHIFDRSEEEFGGVFENCIPGKFGLPGREFSGTVSVIFYLRLKLHLLHVRDELRSRLVSQLSKVLMNSVAFDEANFGIELCADVFIHGDEAIEIVLKD